MAAITQEVMPGGRPSSRLYSWAGSSGRDNHGMLVFEGARTRAGAEFLAYDPNDPERPARLAHDRERRAFSLRANRYWRGGQQNVVEILRGWYL